MTAPKAILCLLSGAAVGLDAQIKLDLAAESAREALRTYEGLLSDTRSRTLPCRVRPIPARMGFGLRFWTGFEVTIPLTEFPAKDRRAAVMIRVQSKRARPDKQAATPVYFWQGWQIPDTFTSPTGDVTAGGGFYVGPGEYDVEWLLAGMDNRNCHARWVVRAKGSASRSALAPGEVDAVGVESWRAQSPPDPKAPSATILLHAAPVWRRPNVVHLSSYDRMMLLSSLTSLLDLSGFSSVRLVAYDAGRRRVLLEEEQFTPAAYRRLSQSLRETNYGVVDFKVLKDGPTEAAFLASLIETDRAAPNPSSLMIFLGPELNSTRRLPSEMERLIEKMPRTFYLALARQPVSQGDVIQKLVKSAKGKMFLILRRQDLLAPIRAIRQRGNQRD